MKKLYIDDREPKSIIEELKEQFNDVNVIRLSVGDYLYGNCIIERKSTNDFINCISNELVWKQTQDLLNVPGVRPYILITSKIRDFEWIGINTNTILGAMASLESVGISVTLIENDYYFIKYMKMLFDKHNDGKNRAINPQRKQVTMQDKIENVYANFPGLGPGLAKKLKEKYPTIESLSTVTIKELKEISGIGLKKARQTFNFIHGIE